MLSIIFVQCRLAGYSFPDGGKKTTGLDAAAIRDASGIDPQLPIPSTSIDRLSLDVEGMVANADGSCVPFTITAMITSMTSFNRFWVSDEYGPYIYLFSADGALLHAIAPPAAVLPTRNGSVNFTSVEDPDAGRAANQGMCSSSAGTLAVRLIDLLAHLLTCC